MKKLTIIIGLMCLMGLMGKANGQAVARLSADTILLGDQTTLSIQRAHTYPSTDQLSQNGIVALSQQFDTAKHTQLTTLTSFEPGVHFIKLSPDDSLQLTVLDVDVDTTTAEIRDIAPIEKVPYTFWEIFRWVLLGLAIVALALGGWWLWKKWKSGKVSDWFANTPVDTRTPEERALDNLEELRQRQLWQAGKVKEYSRAYLFTNQGLRLYRPVTINGKPMQDFKLATTGEGRQELQCLDEGLTDLKLSVVVPEGYLFCCGDNREVSVDSRKSEVGMVNVDDVVGRVIIRLFPFNSIKTF